MGGQPVGARAAGRHRCLPTGTAVVGRDPTVDHRLAAEHDRQGDPDRGNRDGGFLTGNGCRLGRLGRRGGGRGSRDGGRLRGRRCDGSRSGNGGRSRSWHNGGRSGSGGRGGGRGGSRGGSGYRRGSRNWRWRGRGLGGNVRPDRRHRRGGGRTVRPTIDSMGHRGGQHRGTGDPEQGRQHGDSDATNVEHDSWRRPTRRPS